MQQPTRALTCRCDLLQERATKISHGNVGKLLAKSGDKWGSRICAKIAGDEARHEKAYQSFVQRVRERAVVR